jgi:CheY-like chemotaxis protein
VLLADDNEDFVDSLGQLLASRGHDVRIAYDGARRSRSRASSARDRFVDIGMPKVHGYDVARRLRADDGNRALHAGGGDGWGQESDRARAREAGFDRHLTKPVDPAEIAAILEASEGRALVP